MPETPLLTIPSQLEKLDDVQNFTEGLKDWANLDEDTLAGVSLAVSEAATNAIKHGNKEDEQKKVTIQATLTGNELRIHVEDEGEGFDPAGLPDPLAEENLLKPSGRGVYLMKQYCDAVKYSDKGNQVTLFFKL